jgi:hypothetical protein
MGTEENSSIGTPTISDKGSDDEGDVTELRSSASSMSIEEEIAKTESAESQTMIFEDQTVPEYISPKVATPACSSAQGTRTLRYDAPAYIPASVSGCQQDLPTFPHPYYFCPYPYPMTCLMPYPSYTPPVRTSEQQLHTVLSHLEGLVSEFGDAEGVRLARRDLGW